MKFRFGLLGFFLLTSIVSAPLAAREKVDPGFDTRTAFLSKWKFSTEKEMVESVTSDGEKRVSLPFARLWPSETVATDVAVSNERGKLLIEAQMPLIVMRNKVVVACEMARPPGHENFICLIDRDDDGVFEFYAKAPAGLEYFFTGASIKPSKVRKLATPVAYADRSEWVLEDKLVMHVSASLDNDDLFTGARTGFGFCVEKSDLNTIWGGQRSTTNCLDAGARTEVERLPLVRVILGTIVQLRRSKSGGVELVTRPLVEEGTADFN